MSLRDQDGKSLFAVSPSELENGRQGAAYPDTKYLSQEGEWFLAGVLEGLPDGKHFASHDSLFDVTFMFCVPLVMPAVSFLPA